MTHALSLPVLASDGDRLRGSAASVAPETRQIRLSTNIAPSLAALPAAPQQRPMHTMKTRLTMRAALAFGLPSLALGIGRMRRAGRDLRRRAGHEVGRGNVLTATALVALYLAGL